MIELALGVIICCLPTMPRFYKFVETKSSRVYLSFRSRAGLLSGSSRTQTRQPYLEMHDRAPPHMGDTELLTDTICEPGITTTTSLEKERDNKDIVKTVSVNQMYEHSV
jgi:hypothetical protein